LQTINATGQLRNQNILVDEHVRKSSRESLRRSTSPSNRMVQTAPNGFGIKKEVLVSTALPTPK